VTLQPDAADSIFGRIRDAIAAASRITNFSRNSPERAIAEAFAAGLRERQHELLSVQLSARLEYAGAEITTEDLEDLGVDPSAVDLELLNSLQQSQDLDELALRNGVTRDPGSFATGTVTFQTATDGVVVPAGTRITTQPDSSGDVVAFETDAEESPAANTTSVDAAVTAVERGQDGNVGADALTQLPAPPDGVTGVSNANPTTGGEDEETDAELRERTRLALVGTAGGGTAEGVRSGLVERHDGLDLTDVVIDEQFSASPPTFDVVVEGGPSDTTLSSDIDELQPVAIEGTLIRPTNVTIDVSVTVAGSDIDTARVDDAIRELIAGLGIGDDVIRDQLIAAIMASDDGIVGIDSLSTSANGAAFSGDRAIGAREAAEIGTVSVSVA
jgi:uncharacterized phage protein gp47/JayE